MIDLNAGKISRKGKMPAVGTKIRVPVPRRKNWDDSLARAYLQARVVPVSAVEEKTAASESAMGFSLSTESAVVENQDREVAPATVTPLAADTFAPQAAEAMAEPVADVVEGPEIAATERPAQVPTPKLELHQILQKYRPPELPSDEVDTGVRNGTAEYFWYQVKVNDTVGEILERFNLSPLWGKNNFVDRTTAMNEGRVRKTGNRINAGSWIRIPMPSAAWESPVQMSGRPQTTEESLQIQALEPEPIAKHAPHAGQIAVQKSRSPGSELPESPNFDETKFSSRDVASYPPEIQERLRIPQALEVMESRSYLGAPLGKFSFRPTFKVRQMQVKDTARNAAAKLSSDMNFDLTAAWQKELKEKYSVLLGYNMETLSIRPPAGFELVSAGKLLNTLWTGFAFEPSVEWQAQLRLGMTEQLHLVSITETAVTVAKVTTPFADLGLTHAILFYGPLSVNLGGGAKTYMPGSGAGVATQMGLAVYAFAEERIVLNPSHVLGVTGSLEMAMLKADVSDSRDSAIGLSVFWIWKPE